MLCMYCYFDVSIALFNEGFFPISVATPPPSNGNGQIFIHPPTKTVLNKVPDNLPMPPFIRVFIPETPYNSSGPNSDSECRYLLRDKKNSKSLLYKCLIKQTFQRFWKQTERICPPKGGFMHKRHQKNIFFSFSQKQPSISIEKSGLIRTKIDWKYLKLNEYCITWQSMMRFFVELLNVHVYM